MHDSDAAKMPFLHPHRSHVGYETQRGFRKHLAERESRFLPSWELFVTCFKDHFIPSGWRLSALAGFCLVAQGSRDFQGFVMPAPGGAKHSCFRGVGYTISDSVFRNHFLRFVNLSSAACSRTAIAHLRDHKCQSTYQFQVTTWASLVRSHVMTTIPSLVTTLRSFPWSQQCQQLPIHSQTFRILSVRSFVLPVVVTTAALHPVIQDHQARNCPGDLKPSS